ncbi:hypothetical protein NDU88_009805 [Pleurodeles waltl]|uniref:Uncharacterized protein n=1 Tax=Pleurodeles waltl TaxID=8319 RepID=A0AAV7QVK9_PLEWA|nr:hypothetical protein NDU88_009805 [Pleurodeles waltl]
MSADRKVSYVRPRYIPAWLEPSNKASTRAAAPEQDERFKLQAPKIGPLRQVPLEQTSQQLLNEPDSNNLVRTVSAFFPLSQMNFTVRA